MTVSHTEKELKRRVAEASEPAGREVDGVAMCADAKQPRVVASATGSKGVVDLGVCPGTWRLVLREDRFDSRPDEKAFFDDACSRIFDGAKD
jgi:hypothetical protein